MVLSLAIRSGIIVVSSGTSFCFSHHQSPVCISVYTLSSSSLNCRMGAYARFARKGGWPMRNLIPSITSRYWIETMSSSSSSTSDAMMRFCSIHLSFYCFFLLFQSPSLKIIISIRSPIAYSFIQSLDLTDFLTHAAHISPRIRQ